MSGNDRKELVWSIKKRLYQLTANEAFEVATSIGPVEGFDLDTLNNEDEEKCVEYLSDYLTSDTLLELEDEGMSTLLCLKDFVDKVLVNREKGTVLVEVHTEVEPETPPLLLLDDSNATTDTHDLALGGKTHADDYTAAKADAHGTDTQALLLSNELQHRLGQRSVHTNTLGAGRSQPTLGLQSSKPHIDYLLQPQPLLSGHAQPSKEQVPHLHLPHTNTNHQHSPHSSHTTVDSRSTHAGESMIALRDLPLLSRREFKIHGGQISDTISDINYSSICKQVDEGLREKHTEGEVIRGVLRAIKPGNFKDMLTNKEDMTVTELKSFLQSHLGEKSSTELFQDLMCAKQHEHETPQQFLYRMIGLKQKIMFASKQTNSVVKCDAFTAQCVFLNTIYQGIGEKHEDVRRELKLLLADPTVSDEALLKQVIKTTTEENERKRRLGRSSNRKVTQVHSTLTGPEETTGGEERAKPKNKDNAFQRLSAQVEALTQAMNTLTQRTTPTQSSDQVHPHPPRYGSDKPRPEKQTSRPYGCTQCIARGHPDCNHCFACGEEGHRAVGCLRKHKQSGNGNRSRQRDHP